MEPFSWAKFFSGFNIFKGANFGKISYVIVIVLLVSVGTNLWEKFFPSKPNVVNVAGDYNAEQKDAAGIGCNLWKAYIRAGVK